jgi:hypothetical protein
MVFAEFVNDNAEDLREEFVDFQGKKKLIVELDYTDKSIECDIRSKDFDWANFSSKFSYLIGKNTKGKLR